MNYSQITKDLFVGTTPSQIDYGALRKLGVSLVINMRFGHGRPPGDDSAMKYLRLRTFDTPLLPIPLKALEQGAEAALETVRGGGKVYVHCSKGRHRGVAMATAILIAQGLPSGEAMRLLKERRSEADPDAFYIRRRILSFERRWRKRMLNVEGEAQKEKKPSARRSPE